MKIAHWLIYWCCLCTLSPAYCENLESHTLKRLRHAKSGRSIEAIQGQYDLLRELRMACRMEVSEQWVPKSCYEALHLESDLGLHPLKYEREHLSGHLDQKCFEASQQLRGELKTSPHMSMNCKKRVRIARDLQIYKAADLARSLN